MSRARGALLAAVVLLASQAKAEVRAAAVDFATRGLKPQLGAVYAERFALFLRQRGVAVTTSKDISTMLSLERQKQLLGCSESSASCLTELAGALGVSVLITGQVGKLGRSLQLNVKLVDARTAVTVFQFAKTLKSEEEVLEALEATAPAAAATLRDVFPDTPATSEEKPVAPPAALSAPVVLPLAPPRVSAAPVGPWVVTSAGGFVLGGGVGVLVAAALLTPVGVSESLTPSAVETLKTQAGRLQLVGAVTAGVGAAALLAGLLWLRFAVPTGAPEVALSIDGRGALVALYARF